MLTETFPLKPSPSHKEVGSCEDGQENVIGYALVPGCETYKGLGWYGALMQKL